MKNNTSKIKAESLFLKKANAGFVLVILWAGKTPRYVYDIDNLNKTFKYATLSRLKKKHKAPTFFTDERAWLALETCECMMLNGYPTALYRCFKDGFTWLERKDK